MPSQIVPGQPITYTVVARNLGPSDANGAILSDTIPATILSPGWTCTSLAAACPAPSGTGNLDVTLDLTEGGILTYTVTGTVDASAAGTLVNTAVLTASAGPIELQPADNIASVETQLGPEANLSVVKSHEVAGGWITYTIAVHNAGPSNAPGVLVSDTVPAGLSDFAWTGETYGGATSGGSGAGSIQDTVDLPAGSSITYTVTSRMLQESQIVNKAEVIVPQGVTDPDSTNNQAVDRFGAAIYFPLVYKGYAPQPDLVVTGLTATTNEVRATIQNAGAAATVNDFWVDVYFNPIVTPPRIEPEVASDSAGRCGLGCDAESGPRRSLESATGGDYYWPTESSELPYPAGADTWAYVDAINFATTWGAVRESNEGNNTFGPVASPVVDAASPKLYSGRGDIGDLPPR